MNNKNLLKILFIEDLPSDVDLAVLELRKENLKFEHATVCTKDDLFLALKEFKPDLIISDYMMPTLNGLQALHIVRELQPEIPFILFTGSVNEETAVACLKAGALDYVIKEHMTRLPFAVKEALEQVISRKEKRASELLLKESEEKLQSIFSAAPVGIGLVVNRVLMEVNDSFCRIVGYKRSELIGKSSELLYPSSKEYNLVGKEKYQQIAEKGTGSVETLFKRKDGIILNVILGSTPLDKNDHSKGITFTVLDITERKIAEEALRISEARFRDLYNDAVVGLYRTNSNGEILLANNALIRILGFSSFEELSAINLNRSGIGTTQQRKKFIDHIEKYGEVKDLEAVWICRDGKEIYVRENARLVRDLEGNILYYDGTVEDITEKKKNEEELEESHRSINTLIGNIQGMVYRCRNDKFWTMVFLSEGTRELTGYSPEDLLDNNKISYTDLIHKDDQDAIRKEVQAAIKEKRHFQYTYRILTKSGELRWVWEKGEGLFNREGKLEYLEGFITDITDRIQAEESLKSSYSLLNASLESTADGILIVDGKGKIIKWNHKFAEMWRIPDNILDMHEDEAAIDHIINELTEPEKFLKTVKELYSTPEKLSFDNLEFKDGRIFERFSQPQRIEDEVVGRVWSFRDITLRHNAELSLRVSEERFRSIAENLSDIIFITDKAGIIKYISPSCKIFGYTQDEFIGNFFGEFLAEGELEKGMQLFKNALNALKINNIVTLIFKRKDGTNFYAELSGSVFNIGNENSGVLGLIRDVSDKIKKEIELRKLSQAVEQNPVSIIITNTDGDIEYVNPKLCEITGYSKDELIGKNPRVFSSGEKSKEEYLVFWETIKAGNDWKGVFHNKKKNGDLYWESVTVSPIKNENGEIAHYLGTKEDITEKMIMKAAVVENEQRYRELFLNNPAPTYIFDTDSLEFIEVNDATIISYGYTREEFAAMTLKDLRELHDIPQLIESVGLLGKDTYHSIDIRHKKKDGTVFPVEIYSHALPEKNGRKSRLVMATDITNRVKASEQMKLAKEKAEASDKLKTTFLHNISHEVRTPLNGILGFAEIMSQVDLTEEEKKDSLRMLNESSDRLLNTITNYMDISLITSGSLSVHKKDFPPAQIIRDVFDEYKKICSSKKLNFILDIPEYSGNITVNSDPEIFQKILTHLLNNAVKFTEKGTVSYGYTILNNSIEVFVKDTGVGIGNESLSLIFDNFVKEDRGPLMITEGSGLGLSIAKGMIHFIDGNLRVESEVGVGSGFYFSIPRIIDSTVTIVDSSGSAIKGKTNGTTILVAEDDDTNFFYLNALLTRDGDVTVIHASNGREAIELFKSNPDIQLILMDIKMPEIDGLEATRQIKLLNSNVPVVAITAYAMSGDEERILAAGCDGYLSKPISKKSLMGKMAEFIKV
jgi:PAS domain S-box-containing protein